MTPDKQDSAKSFAFQSVLLCLAILLVLASGGGGSVCFASPSVNGDPFIDDLHSLAFESESPFWRGVKEQLTNGNVDYAIKQCRQALARRTLEVDMHCLYAMALEMKLRRSQYDPDLFNECVREWAHVAKFRFTQKSNSWDNVGEGEAFYENDARKKLANRHLVSLVGRSPKFFESEEAFVRKAIQTSTQVAGKVRSSDKTF